MKFLAVGVLNTAIDFAIYVALTRLAGFFATYFILAKIISFLAGTVHSLFLNHYWTFRKQGMVTGIEGLKFYATTLSSLVMNAGLMYICVSVFSVNDILAFIITTGVVLCWNFVLSKAWVFR